MKSPISSRSKRLSWTLLALLLAFVTAVWLTSLQDVATVESLTDGDFMNRLIVFPLVFSLLVLGLLTACSNPTVKAGTNVAPTTTPPQPFMAQVVGVQWLNPLQRRDYSTEWELLWTLTLVQPNKDDDMVKTNPKKFTALQSIKAFPIMNLGTETFKGFHHRYVEKLTSLFHDIYFQSSRYFYNAHSRDNKKTWRELAGIHIEYALPEGRLDPTEAGNSTRDNIINTFQIGNTNFPTLWSRSTPPDVHVTMGGANAGFTSLAAGLDYLQAHPNETVWVMSWDAPNFPKDQQINENMVLLVLAGPDYKTERNALAWIGYPASKSATDFEAKKGEPARIVQAWKAVMETATHNARKQDTDIGYIIHDANNTQPNSSERIGKLAQTLTMELIEFDFSKQTFNTPALLGEMGAATALTNVALGIAYANHFGKNVLVAGTSDVGKPTGVLVVPPEKVRYIRPDEKWSRARGENHAYLPWWGLRHDAQFDLQGFSD
jgi:hypothetical protein